MPITIKQYDNIPKNTVGLKGVTKRLLILKTISNCGMLCLGPRSLLRISASGYLSVKCGLASFVSSPTLSRWHGGPGGSGYVRTYKAV